MIDASSDRLRQLHNEPSSMRPSPRLLSPSLQALPCIPWSVVTIFSVHRRSMHIYLLAPTSHAYRYDCCNVRALLHPRRLLRQQRAWNTSWVMRREGLAKSYGGNPRLLKIPAHCAFLPAGKSSFKWYAPGTREGIYSRSKLFARSPFPRHLRSSINAVVRAMIYDIKRTSMRGSPRASMYVKINRNIT